MSDKSDSLQVLNHNIKVVVSVIIFGAIIILSMALHSSFLLYLSLIIGIIFSIINIKNKSQLRSKNIDVEDYYEIRMNQRILSLTSKQKSKKNNSENYSLNILGEKIALINKLLNSGNKINLKELSDEISLDVEDIIESIKEIEISEGIKIEDGYLVVPPDIEILDVISKLDNLFRVWENRDDLNYDKSE